MRRNSVHSLAALVLGTFLLLAMRAGPNALYLPLAARMPTPSLPSLSGRGFFDYNGSGLQEQGEPGIQGVPVFVGSLGSALRATTGADGSYSISNIPPGEHPVYVQSPTQDPATAFRYINRFLGWVDIPAYEMNGVHVPTQHLPDTEIQSVDQPLASAVSQYTELNVALMQGSLLWPPVEQIECVATFFDHDPRSGYVLDWRGNTTPCDYNIPYTPNAICDNHLGTDFIAQRGKWVYAAAPGVVNWAGLLGNAKHVTLSHFLDWSFATGYGHLDSILVTFPQSVYNGQIIGTLGATGTYSGPPHLHFNFHYNLIRQPSGAPVDWDPFGSPFGDYPSFWIRRFNPSDFPPPTQE